MLVYCDVLALQFSEEKAENLSFVRGLFFRSGGVAISLLKVMRTVLLFLLLMNLFKGTMLATF